MWMLYSPKKYKDCNGNCLNDEDGDGVCDEENNVEKEKQRKKKIKI